MFLNFLEAMFPAKVTLALEMTMICGFIFLTILFLERIVYRVPQLPIPRVGIDPGFFAMTKAKADFSSNGRRIAENGYQRFKESAFKVQTADMERIVLSNKYINELRNLPESHLSVKDAVCDRHLGWYTTLDVIKQSNLHSDVCRVQLTQNIATILPGMIDDLEYSFQEHLSECASASSEFYCTKAYPMLLKTANISISRALVGPELCRNSLWLETTIGYVANVFAISAKLRDRAHILRPFVYLTLPARHQVKHYRELAHSLLEPVIAQRRTTRKRHTDVLQFMIDNAKGADGCSRRLSEKLLMICLAAINSNTKQVLNVLLDLCASPEHIETLRREIMEQWNSGGKLTFEGLNQMKRLDSCLKESQRLNHPGLFSFNRKVLKPITLSSGLHLPTGTFISMSTYGISRDPNYYPNPDQFHPFRFYDLRAAAESSELGAEKGFGSASNLQLTSTSVTSLPWGYGKAACPGRFFASAHMKLWVAMLIQRYDFQFSKGIKRRPENIFVDERTWPSMDVELEFRKR